MHKRNILAHKDKRGSIVKQILEDIQLHGNQEHNEGHWIMSIQDF
jgi:hypothetical protein